MKKMAVAVAAVVLVALVTGCATSYPIGSLYTKLQLPVGVTSNGSESSKVGTAQCTSILGMVATGDASIEAAKKNGGITKVHHVDWDVENILGVIGKYKVIVYGE